MRQSSSLHTEDWQADISAWGLSREGVGIQLLHTFCCSSKSHLLLSYPSVPKPIYLTSQWIRTGSTSLCDLSAMPSSFSLQEYRFLLKRRTSPFHVGFCADIWGFKLFPASQIIFHVSFLWIPHQRVIYWWGTHYLLWVSYIAVTLKTDKGCWRQTFQPLPFHQLADAWCQTCSSGLLAPHLLCIYFESQRWHRQDQ